MNKLSAEIRNVLAALKKAGIESTDLENALKLSKNLIVEKRRTVEELQAIDADPRALSPFNPGDPGTSAPRERKVGMKTMFLKNGKTLQIQSAIRSGDTVTYKDENGETHTLNAAEYDRTETNK